MSELHTNLNYVYDLRDAVGAMRNDYNGRHPLFQEGASYSSVGVYVDGADQPSVIAYEYTWGAEQHDQVVSWPVRSLLKAGRVVGMSEHLPPANGWPGRQGGVGLYEMPTVYEESERDRARIAYQGVCGILTQMTRRGSRLLTVHGLVAADNRAVRAAYLKVGFEPSGRHGKLAVLGQEPQRVKHDELVLDFYQYSRQQQ